MDLVRALAIAVLACALWCAPAAAQEPEHADLLLRLSDLPAGYLIGDDTGCGDGIAAEEAPAVLERMSREHPNSGCSIEFERLWGTDGPRLVWSDLYAFEDVAGATAGLDVAEPVVEHTLGVTAVEPLPPPAEPGDAAVTFAVTGDRPGTVVVWRSGRFLAVLLVAGRPAVAGPGPALAIARVQQGRMAAPTPIPRGENDDTLVPLDDPGLGIPVWWLGRRFDPPGRLRPTRLRDVWAPLPWRDGLGRVRLEYRGADVMLWRRGAFRRFARTEVGRLVRTRACVEHERLEISGRRAFVHADRCGRRHGQFLWAHAVLEDDVVATVRMPVCTMCLDDRIRHRSGYASRAGLEAVLRGLRRR